MICPTERDIERLLTAPEPATALDALREHARTCSACAQALDRGAAVTLAATLANRDAHPDSIALSRYLDGNLAPLQTLVAQHLSHCSGCSKRLAAMRSGRADAAAQPAEFFAPHPIAEAARPPRPGPTAGLRWAAAAAVLAAFVLVYFGWRGPRGAELRDGPLALALVNGDLQIHGVSRDQETLIRAKLGLHGVPRTLVALPPLPRTLGGDRPDRSTLLAIGSPLPDEAVLEPKVRIQWSPIPEVEMYAVRVYRDSDMDTPVWETATQMHSVTAQLRSGERYVVTVTGRMRDSEAKRYSPPVAFRVLGEPEASAIRGAAAALGDSHLLKGILYEQHLVVASALSEYRRLADANPHSPIARSIYDGYRSTFAGE